MKAFENDINMACSLAYTCKEGYSVILGSEWCSVQILRLGSGQQQIFSDQRLDKVALTANVAFSLGNVQIVATFERDSECRRATFGVEGNGQSRPRK